MARYDQRCSLDTTYACKNVATAVLNSTSTLAESTKLHKLQLTLILKIDKALIRIAYSRRQIIIEKMMYLPSYLILIPYNVVVDTYTIVY